MVGVHLTHRALVSRACHHEGADPDVLLVHSRRVSVFVLIDFCSAMNAASILQCVSVVEII